MISNLQDVQHIFAHRNIYDQGDLFTEKFKIINSKGIIVLKGSHISKVIQNQ